MLSEIRKQNEEIVKARNTANQKVAEVREKLNNNHNLYIRSQKKRLELRIQNKKDEQGAKVLKG